jgi:protein-S-isoprenylcysteine O-methyltransferase Ste14
VAVLQYINVVWGLVAIYWVVGMVLKSAAEEKFMREEFSTEYARYGQRVRRLIPFVY